MGSFIQIIGAVLVLAGFVLAQRGVLTHTCAAYLVLNLIGSAVLAGDAMLQRQWASCSWRACGRWCRRPAWSSTSTMARAHVAPGRQRHRLI